MATGRPARTPEAREKQVICAAMDLAEKQILEGTASAQVIVHFLKLGSIEKQLELERLRSENDLLKAKKKAIEHEQDTDAKYIEAINAMRAYGKGFTNGVD